jgi:hypothetical protein
MECARKRSTAEGVGRATGGRAQNNGAENRFSRLREKVAGDSRPDEGWRHDSLKIIPLY